MKKDKFDLVRFADNDFELDVRADSENETVWLTQEEMAKLFDVNSGRISRHINNIFKKGELSKKSNLRKTQFAQSDKPNSTSKNVLFVYITCHIHLRM